MLICTNRLNLLGNRQSGMCVTSSASEKIVATLTSSSKSKLRWARAAIGIDPQVLCLLARSKPSFHCFQ